MARNLTTSGVYDGSERVTLGAWILFNLSSPAIYVDHGVSSMTDDGVGQSTVTLSPGLGTNAYVPVSDTEANSKSAINQYNDVLCDVLLRNGTGDAYVDSNFVQLLIGGG